MLTKPLNFNLFNQIDIDQFGKIDERSGQISFGCLMLFFETQNWNLFEKNIDSNDLYQPNTHGLEKDPHITLLCGIKDNAVEVDDVKDVIKNINISARQVLSSVQLKDINYFDNPKFDVLKVNVESSLLRSTNSQLKDLPYDELWPTYQPHLTIAYLKKGRGEEYKNLLTKKNILNDINLINGRFVYSDRNFNETKIDF